MLNIQELNKKKASVRKLKDIADVIYDKEWYQTANQEKILYWMWRGLEEKDGLRYDVLQFNDGNLGQELMKTAGHGHSLVPNTELSYPELYQVLQGEVVYLLQSKKDKKINRVISVYCKEKEFCLVPPNFEHITINLTGSKTFMANWIASQNRSDYFSIKEKNGGAYFGLVDSPVAWQKNEACGELPKIENFQPTDFKSRGIDIEENMLYNREDIKVLNFLKNPQEYQNLWSSLY